MLVMVITAPAMEAPEGSVTSPERDARNSCALSTPAIKTKEASASLFIRNLHLRRNPVVCFILETAVEKVEKD